MLFLVPQQKQKRLSGLKRAYTELTIPEKPKDDIPEVRQEKAGFWEKNGRFFYPKKT